MALGNIEILYVELLWKQFGIEAHARCNKLLNVLYKLIILANLRKNSFYDLNCGTSTLLGVDWYHPTPSEN